MVKVNVINNVLITVVVESLKIINTASFVNKTVRSCYNSLKIFFGKLISAAVYTNE